MTTEFRAAGTDLSERRRSGVSKGPLMDIVPASDISGMNWGADGTLRIGAYTTIAAIAADRSIAAAYPGIAASAQGLATPQIRHLATLGGNIAQRSRCWYFRNPHIACLKKGGTDCPARAAIISIMSPSISAPAWRRILPRWRRRCSPMMRPSSPTREAGCRSRTCSATAPTAQPTTCCSRAR